MLKAGLMLVVGFATINFACAESNNANAERNRSVLFTGDFESGEIKPKDSAHDGFYLKTLPDPQRDAKQIAISHGGAGPASGLDVRVVPNETVGSEIIRPRQGNFFLRSAVYFDKDYTGFIGNSGKNKPRFVLTKASDGWRIPFDTEVYTGFSIRIPENIKHEIATRDARARNGLLTVATPGANTVWGIGYYVDGVANNTSSWFLTYQVNDQSTDEKHKATKAFSIRIGDMVEDGDVGKWTDFIIRWRANPFTTKTNAHDVDPGGRNKVYEGNQGILQVWKSVGGYVDANNNRKMVRVFSKVNEPVGIVPLAMDDDKNGLSHSWRQYKHSWHHQAYSFTTPNWIGFDELRFGRVIEDGTGYSDVHPSQLGCTDGCPTGTPVEPPVDARTPNPPVLAIFP